MLAVTVPCSMPVGRLAIGSSDAAHHLLQQRRSRNIDLGDRKSQQRIAHHSAADARFLAVAIEQARNFAIMEPSGIAQMRHARHRYVCGTNLPSSVCAGT
jgi:hypothetical protein